MNFNLQAFQFIYGFAHRNALLDGLGIFIAQYLPYLMVLGFLILAFGKKDSRLKFLIFAEGAVAVILSRGIVTEVIRFFYHHLRPEGALGISPLITEAGYSFPSGHAAWFFALAMVIWYYSKKMAGWYFLLSAIMGVARIFVGVHWPLDIISGFIVGILCGAITHVLFKPTLERILHPHAHAEPAPPPAL